MQEKKYITQLTAEDLRELSAASNPTPGFMMRVEKTPGELKLSIDENALKIGIIGFLRNIGAIYISPSVSQITETSMNLS